MITPKTPFNITRKALRSVPLTTPLKAGNYWQGIKHSQLITTIEDAFAFRKWKIERMEIAISCDEQDLAASFDITLPKINAVTDMHLSIGVTTSNALRRAMTLYTGMRVVESGIGIALTKQERAVTFKHTNKNCLHTYIDNSLTKSLSYWSSTGNEAVLKLQTTGRDVWEADEILVKAGRLHILPWSRIGKTIELFRSGEYDQTNWGLLQAFGTVNKKTSPLNQMDCMVKFAMLLHCGA